MSTVKCSWSGGKDSTAAVLLHLERGDVCKVVCYIPYFDEHTPLILNDHYQHLIRTARRFEEMGAEVYFVHGITYCEYFFHRSTRGKYKGRMFCWPCFLRGCCGFKRDSKVKALDRCDCGHFDYRDVGIAYDEKDRQAQLSESRRSILVEMRITEKEAFEICRLNGMLSPIYNRTGRDGCALCPNAKKSERVKWLNENPHVVSKLLEMQHVASIERPGMYPLRNCQNFIESEARGKCRCINTL